MTFLARGLLAAFALTLFLGAAPAPCCGPITPEGQRLAAALDHSGVDHLWQAHIHILWQSGEPDPARPGWFPHVTHCSAFAAAFAARLGIYVLRPPAHSQDLLASAQFRWLGSTGEQQGWKQVDAVDAQTLANRGWLVLASLENPNPHRPGHIAVVRPSEKSMALLLAHGPEETQAGGINRLRTTVAHGFRSHPDGWEQGGTGTIRFFAHRVDWSHVAS